MGGPNVAITGKLVMMVSGSRDIFEHCKEVFEKIKTNLKKNNIKYFDEPYVRFKGKVEEQETFFLEDPHGNVLELKTFSK